MRAYLPPAQSRTAEKPPFRVRSATRPELVWRPRNQAIVPDHWHLEVANTPIVGERRKRSIHSTSNPYRFRFIEGWLEGEAFLRGFLAQVDDARPYLTCLTALFISDGRLLDPTPPGFECRHVSFGPL